MTAAKPSITSIGILGLWLTFFSSTVIEEFDFVALGGACFFAAGETETCFGVDCEVVCAAGFEDGCEAGSEVDCGAGCGAGFDGGFTGFEGALT